MTKRPGNRQAMSAILALAATAAMLSGCKTKTSTVAGNDVQMRDMEVVDGTTNDAMTDLDAVSANDISTSSNASAAGN